jgi:hypothetical protein
VRFGMQCLHGGDKFGQIQLVLIRNLISRLIGTSTGLIIDPSSYFPDYLQITRYCEDSFL